MSKRKFFYFAFCLVFVFTLMACNSKEANQAAPAEDKKTNEKKNNGELAQGITDDEILIGHLGPQTGPAAMYDIVRKSIDTYFNYVNENGGVNGRKLKLVAYDDQYQPAQTVKMAKKLVEEDKVFATLGNICSPCNMAALDYYKEKGIPMVMLQAGASEFVDPPIKNYMGTGMMNYDLETAIFMDYAINDLNAKKIAIVYQNDDFGKAGLEGAKEAIKNYSDVEVIAEIPFLVSDTDFSSHAQKLSELKPDAIFASSLANPAANLKKAMYKIGFKDAHFIVSSVGGGDENLFELAGQDVWEGTYSGAVYPSPKNVPDDPNIKLFVERFSKDYPNEPISGFSQSGWAIGEVLVEALERTGDDLIWDNFLESFYSFDNWKGSMYAGITFSEDNHYGLNSMFISQAQDGKILPVTDTITIDPTTREIKK